MGAKRRKKQDAATPATAQVASLLPQRQDRHAWWPVVLITLAAAGVYANSLSNGFLYDDDHIVRDDVRTRDPSQWKSIFTKGYWHGRSNDPLYRPIPLLTYLINHQVSGFSPAGYRVVNIALHACVSLLVCAIALQLFERPWAAVLAGVLFAVHPIHGEVVVIVIGRADLLCTLFYLLALWQVSRDPLTRRPRFSPRLSGVLVFLALALFSKESAITFPAAAVLVDLWRRWQASDEARPRPWLTFLTERLLRRYLPILFVCALSLLIRYHVMGMLTRPQGVPGGGIDNALDYAGLVGRLLTPFVLLGKYLNLLAWPNPLCYDYSYDAIPVATSLTDARVWIGLAWTLALLIAAIVSLRHKGGLLACVGLFAVTYSIASNSIVLIGTLFAERMMYLPSVAWCWGVGLLLTAAHDRCAKPNAPASRLRIVVVVIALVGVVGYSAKTVFRNRGALADNNALYADGIRVNPGSSRCQSFAAREFANRGDHKTAIKHFLTAIAIDDSAWYDHMLLGQEYVLDGQVDKGLPYLHRAYEMSTGQYRFDPAFLLGQVYLRTNRAGDAVRWLETALRLRPNHALCNANLAVALALTDPSPMGRQRAAECIRAAEQDGGKDPRVSQMLASARQVLSRAATQPNR
ncbi:MAG: DUF1736 domain-containing protein [Phycisphaerae bacterium]|nr:DUF1736 domain-containing protein [Phycisphaerae bacterium]